MEEKKNASEVRLGVVKNESQEQPQKLSYEQLNQACMELSQENQQIRQYIQKLQKQIQEMAGMLQTKRMDYLFKVVEITHGAKTGVLCFSADFVEDCLAEIQQSLTIPVEEEQPEGETNTEG